VLRASDVAAVREQLGREPTIPFTVVARCTGGHPLVIRNAPLDSHGHPFPTLYWLTCPTAVKEVSRLESAGWIARFNHEYETDAEFREALDAAHLAYAEERAESLLEASRWGGVGGTRTGVKCLHAHYAYALAGGDDPVGELVDQELNDGYLHAEEPVRSRAAVIDQGTNSTRLLIAEPTGSAVEDLFLRPEDAIVDGFTELARDMVITRLGKDVDRTGLLDSDALARTLSVIERFARRAEILHAERIRIGMTSAVRDAKNRNTFLDAVREKTATRVEPEIIDGQKEAELSFLGGTYGLDPSEGPFCVMDIGGGSTEFIVDGKAISTQMGSVRLTERFVRLDPPAQEELEAVRIAVDEILDEVESVVPVRDARTLVAVAGTATTTQAVALGLDVHDPERIHRSWLTLADVERMRDRFAAMTNAERAALAVMPRGRGDVITAGVVILVTAMRRFGFERALVSETDILDGLVLEMLGIG
jgi:exopolyphosphatase/guanosine-5'-triphosphate,3'-diphosphate pyrophosphatase